MDAPTIQLNKRVHGELGRLTGFLCAQFVQKSSVKPSIVHQEFFQLNDWSIFNGSRIHLLKEVVTDAGLISPSNSENLFSTSSTHCQGIIIYLIHTQMHAITSIVHMIVFLSLTCIYSNNNQQMYGRILNCVNFTPFA